MSTLTERKRLLAIADAVADEVRGLSRQIADAVCVEPGKVDKPALLELYVKRDEAGKRWDAALRELQASGAVQ